MGLFDWFGGLFNDDYSMGSEINSGSSTMDWMSSDPFIETASFDSHATDWTSCCGGCINPASGLPMISDDCMGVDVGGNPYGTDLNDHWDHGSSFDSSNSFDSGSLWD